jgi:hypothetical protein
MLNRVTAALSLILVLAAACGGSSSPATSATSPGGATAEAPTPSPEPEATAGAGDDPLPQHLTFAPGETISADGKAGIFYLDPKTGAAEAWVVPANPAPDLGYYLAFSFTVGGLSSDGSRFIYECKESRANSGPVPCGGSTHDVWYLFDTTSGRRTTLTAFDADLLTISPDGTTLFGETSDGLALAAADHPADPRKVVLPPDADGLRFDVNWSPGGDRLVLVDASLNLFLVRVGDATVTALGLRSYGAAWSSDGAKFAVGERVSENQSRLVVMDRDGEELWSKPMTTGGVGGTWSADGTLLYAEEQERAPAGAGYGPQERVDVLDAGDGRTRYRITGAFCPVGWAGESHVLLTSSYGFGEVVADLDAGSLKRIDVYAMPTPFDSGRAIVFDGSDFRSYELATGATSMIAHTTVTPSWDTLHGIPLFADGRIIFTALHLGHGGCGEGGAPKDPSAPALLAGPFADDAPVTRGGVH